MLDSVEERGQGLTIKTFSVMLLILFSMLRRMESLESFKQGGSMTRFGFLKDHIVIVWKILIF